MHCLLSKVRFSKKNISREKKTILRLDVTHQVMEYMYVKCIYLLFGSISILEFPCKHFGCHLFQHSPFSVIYWLRMCVRFCVCMCVWPARAMDSGYFIFVRNFRRLVDIWQWPLKIAVKSVISNHNIDTEKQMRSFKDGTWAGHFIIGTFFCFK